MPDILLGREQALEASVRFVIVAIGIDQNLRRTAIISHMHSSDAHEPDARIRQFSLHQSFNLFAQGFTQPAAMIFDCALLQRSLPVKRMRISDNRSTMLSGKRYFRLQIVDGGKYRGNKGMGLRGCLAGGVGPRLNRWFVWPEAPDRLRRGDDQ
jgi:hypothetical protein